MPDLFWMIVAYLAGAASAEGVRRTIRKLSGGYFFKDGEAPAKAAK